METQTIRISRAAHERLRTLAEVSSTTMTSLLEEAVEDLHRKRFWEATNAAYAALHDNPDAWKNSQEEIAAWDTTLSDGLENLSNEFDSGE
ncbi:hypothetical protein BH23PLA1_BH23PLA1_02260 [soil metagenome]